MRGGLVLVVVGIDVVAAHGVVDEAVPHKDAAEVGMAVEDDAVEVEDLAFLELGAAPDGGERGQMDAGFAVGGAQADGQRAVLELLREEVVDDFEVAGGGGLLDLVDFFFLGTVGAVDELLDFDLWWRFLWGPVDAGDVGAEVEAQVGGVAEEEGDGEGVAGVDQQGVLGRRAGVGDDLQAAAGDVALRVRI